MTMAAPVTNDLIYEVLKSVQAQIAIVREDMEHIKPRLSSIEHRLGLVHTDMANQAVRLDRIESRMARVENRLNFGEQSQ
jgi:polyhydroxyalkanoate synthesis regulator phasin